MSVVTKVACVGLIRDSAPELVSQANGLRKAENVVLRSPGVLETRPSFELYFESTTTGREIRSLREFGGVLVAVEGPDSLSDWGIRALDTGTEFTQPAGDDPAQPVDYDASETKFAEMRDSLYLTAHRGVLKIADVATPSSLDYAGVDMQVATDLIYTSANYGVRAYTWVYQFVFVREDANGYIRRSPPSERFVISSPTNIPAQIWDSTSPTGRQVKRVYIPRWLVAGDKVEVYRSRSAAGDTPNPDVYLAFTYEITSTDVSAGYFVPPYDTTSDDDLGADLYTNTTQGGAIAAKYAPPIAQAIAQFGQVMWYGNTRSKQRAGFSIRSVNAAGYITGPDNPATMYTSGSPSVQLADTTRYTVGAYWTDNLEDGPSLAGTYVPAKTTISAIPDATHITMSANALATGHAWSAQMFLHARVGFISEEQSVATGTHVAGSPIVTGLGTTDRLRVGMAWTDNTSGGPSVAGTLVPADTFILSIDGPAQITLTKNALASGSGGAAYDVITVAGVDFYLWPGAPWLEDLNEPRTWPTRCVPYWNNYYQNVAFSVMDSENQVATLVASLCSAVNYYQLTHQSTFNVRAVPVGNVNVDFSGAIAVGNSARSIVFEEVGVGGAEFTLSTSCHTAIDAYPSLTSTNDAKPNRLYWSDLGEPESVPLLNYVDVGSVDAPILALVPLRNALLVFKSDGLWRVTGSGPSNWSVEVLDPTLKLLRPEAVTASQNKAYAWCAGGFYAVDEVSSQSLTSEKLDRELRDFAAYITDDPTTHGTFCVAIQQRNLVLLGVPDAAGSSKTAKVYAYNQTTNGWTEWPVSWTHACESASRDHSYYSRPEEPSGSVLQIYYEARVMSQDYRGYDRTYVLGPVSVSGLVVTVYVADIGRWRPVVGDWLSATDGTTRYYRRITAASFNSMTAYWSLTLESAMTSDAGALITDAAALFIADTGVTITAEEVSGWEAHEHIANVIEWQPTAPAGLPIGAICRELQFQMDLTQAPDPAVEQSIPQYIVGGSTERSSTPVTVTSNLTRTRTVQPLRAGVSRQIARGALIAPYFETSDIYAFRLVGASIVHEGFSEKTRR